MFLFFGWGWMLSLIKNLLYEVGDFKLDIPEWSFSDQGVSGLIGPSGSGKTTILKILSGLLPCPGLFWDFQGQNLAALPPPERHLGFCFQDLRLFPHLTARENILFALRARGHAFCDKEKDFEEVTGALGLKYKLEVFIDKLSGGEKQRVALARALILRPRLLFLDEPFSFLDEKNRVKAQNLTGDIIKKYNIPALLISHDKSDIQNLAKDIFFLNQGKIKQK